MNKALEAFNDLKEGYTLIYTGLAVSFTKDFFDEKMSIIESALKENIGLRKAHEFLREDYEKLDERVNDLERIIKEPDTTIKKLKALEIISNISKKTYHFRLKQRQNFGEDEMSYYLVIGYGMSECEYILKSKEEYDILKEVLIDE